MLEEYPRIAAQAKRHGALTFFADEASGRSDCHSGTTWATVGQTPAWIPPGHTLQGECALGDQHPRRADFMCSEQRLVHGQNRPTFLIVDGHPVHCADAVKRCVASTGGRLRPVHLPSYAPNLNPDELVWIHVKQHKVGNLALKGLRYLNCAILSFLRSLQNILELVRAIFQYPHVRCTA